jgi:hypothetical protein
MLKVTGDGPPPGGKRSFGDLASQLVDDAKAYAQAEVDLAKAKAADKVNRLKVGTILLIAAAFVAMGALNALCFGIFVLLATFLGPLLGGIVSFLLIGAVAGVLAWFGATKLRDAL